MIPIIIIGATRSGTNMLRDTLTKFGGVSTWPCDEINYIWRYGNARCPHDEFLPDMANPATTKYIRSQFDKIASKYNSKYVVEKTCANSLRVEFVESIIPEAKYIFITRNGIDSIASAKKRWNAKLDLPYLIKKARYVPMSSIPYYGCKYFFNRLYRLFGGENRLAYWGPQLKGMVKLYNDSNDTLTICAHQWRACIENSLRAFENMPKDKYIHVKYEEFVSNPNKEIKRILEFIGLDASAELITENTGHIFTGSVSKGVSELDATEVQRSTEILSSTLSKLGC